MICSMCPRNCGAERTETAGRGVCRMPAAPVLARAALHFWEEPPISGVNGSGTVFFSGCPLGCVFCQNDEISHRNFGKAVTVERLREICLSWRRRGAQHQSGQPHPLRPCGGGAAGEAAAGAGGVEHRRLR